METKRICPSCGRPLAADSPQGLCPECLIKAGFGTGVAPEPGGPTSQPPFTPPPLAELAKLFPQLEIVELLGRGGMGAVYKARQPALDRWVALKVLPPQSTAKPGFAERFNREARALARLSHANIVAVHEFGQAGGMPYFIMQYVEGVTLRRLVQERRLEPREALRIVPQICEALQFAHDEGVVHRDIKPENILLDKKGRVKIADFGIAKIVGGTPLTPSLSPSDGERVSGRTGEGTLTQDQVLGTPHYMAPEQVEHPQSVDHRADIYSLGVVFYEMLTGELPLGKFAPPSRMVKVDVRLDEVVLHALEKEPERRYQHASEVKTDVETIARTEGGAAKSEPGRSRVAPPVGADGAESVWQQVRGPAIGLVVTAILNLVAIPLILVVTAVVVNEGGFHHGFFVGVPLLVLVLSSITLVAGLKMKRLEAYGLAITGSILAMLITPGNVIGLPIGIWALVVLSHRQVRQAFGNGYSHPLEAAASAAPPASRPDRFWRRFAVVVALVLLAMILIPVGSSILLALLIPNFNKARQDARAIVADSSRFGQVVELAITDLADLDKETVVHLPLPGVLSDRDPARYDWFNSDTNAFPFMRQGGIDLFQGNHGLIGVDLLVVPLESKDWRGLTSTGLRSKLDALQLPKAPATSIINNKRRPFGFQTREGALGILEITDENLPRGVKIRYKLAQPRISSAAPAEPEPMQSEPTSATLPNGVTVRLVGLGLYPTKGKPWWLPDGQECPTPLLDDRDLDIRSMHPSLRDEHTIEFAFAITSLKSGTGNDVRIAWPESTLSAGRQFKNGVVQPEIKALALNVPTNATVAHFRLTFDAEERLRLEYETATNTSPHFDPVRLPAGDKGVAFRNVSLRSGFRTQPSAVVLGSQWPPKRSEFPAPEAASTITLAANSLGPVVKEGVDSTSAVGSTCRFGPAAEILLPQIGAGPRPELFDLDTGRRMREPEFEQFGNNARANIAWIKTNGLDISGLVFDQTKASCLAYYLAVVPAPHELWEEATPAQVLGHAGLANIRDPKRSWISPERDRTDTFLFRTREGTTGILQLLGVTPDRRCVKIRYKLVRPSSSSTSRVVESKNTAARTEYAKYLGLAAAKFAADNDGLMPTNHAALATYILAGQEDPAKVPQGFSPEEFDIVYRGRLAQIEDASKTIILREKEATQTPDGQWVRVCVFADGHVESQTAAAASNSFRAVRPTRATGIPVPSPGGPGVTSAEQAFRQRYGLENALPGGVPAPATPVQVVKKKPLLLAQAAPGEYRVKLTNGVAFEVVATASSPRSGMVWWRPDGTLLAEPPGDRLEFPSQSTGGKARIEFAILTRKTGSPAPDWEWPVACEPRPQVLHTARLYKTNAPAGSVEVIGFEKAPETLACRMGLPDGDWQRVATWDRAGTLLNTANPNLRSLVQKTAGEAAVLTLRHEIDLDRFHLRLVARLPNGEHKTAQVFRTDRGPASAAQMSALIHDLKPADVVAYELYQVPARWIEIPNISTKPDVPPIGARQASAILGAETEVTLTEFNNMDGQEGLDLETGTVFAQPNDLEKWSEEGLAQWVKEKGIDLFVDQGPGRQWGLLTTAAAQLKLAYVTNENWATIGERDLDQALSSGRVPASVPPRGILKAYPLSKSASSAMTLAFQTSSGGKGLLRVAGFTEKPRGVQIRYKLVQDAAALARSLETRRTSTEQPREPNSYVAAALAGMDLAVEKIKEAAAKGELSEMADVFNHFNELCDQLQGKNRNPATTPQDWGIQDADAFRRLTNDLASLEDASERMRDIARSSRRPKAEREAILKGDSQKFVNRYAEFRTLLRTAPQSETVTAPTPDQPTTMEQAPRFGPVIEHQLAAAWAKMEQQVLDLDENQLLTAPTNVVMASFNNPRPLLNWMVQNRTDLIVSGDSPPGDDLGFHLDDGLLVRVDAPLTFDGIDAREVERHLAKTGVSQSVGISKAEVSALPVCVFRTREGGRGVLQVMGYTDNPCSVRIRYKLLGGEAQKPAAAASGTSKLTVAKDGSGTHSSIQAALDAAAEGALVRIGPGRYEESLVITKPVSLLGAGWEQTVIGPTNPWAGPPPETLQEIERKFREAKTDEERGRLREEAKQRFFKPVVRVRGAEDVRFAGIKFTQPGTAPEGKLLEAAVVEVQAAEARLGDCAVVGAPGNGIVIGDGATLSLSNCLIAAAWNTGIRVERGANCRLMVTDSDVRNCHYAGIVIGRGQNDVTVQRCRLSGAAWHGLRYDDASPTIADNLIFANARCGIYASGKTAAQVRGNVFWKNEMSGVACWFESRDRIASNTFAANLREGLAVLGASEPVIERNIFWQNPQGVLHGNINRKSAASKASAKLQLRENLFWTNGVNVASSVSQSPGDTNAPSKLPLTDFPGNLEGDPGFRDTAHGDFMLLPDGAAAQVGIGAPARLRAVSPWPLQPEEKATIPDGDTRDSRQWKNPGRG